MIDKSPFARLKRLFSRDVIIRSVGKGQVKVFDIKSANKTGDVKANYDIYSRTGIYNGSPMAFAQPGSASAQYIRAQYYMDYAAMDRDAYIHAALNLLADESTLENEHNELIKITSSDENIKRILHNLFYDILNIKFNLRSIVRTMCKYGDAYVFLPMIEGVGITGMVSMSPYGTTRQDDLDTGEVKYIYDPSMIGMSSNHYKTIYKDYEIGHFRLKGDEEFLPYGMSYLEGVRTTWKCLTIAEDASLLHRITRSADKRVFFIDIGNLAPNEVEPFIQTIINKTKKIPHVDPNTGEYNLRYNIMNLLEDFYIPVRGNDKQTRIDTAQGLTFAGMEDVEYWKRKMFGGLMIPKAYFGEEGDTQGKGTLSQLDIRLSRLIENIQRVVISELYKIARIHLVMQGYYDNQILDFDLKLTKPSIVYKQEQVALMKEIIDLGQNMMDAELLPTDWIYKNLLELSEDEIDELRDLIIEDKKRRFRYQQIENEGNDPVETGLSYGTRSDLAMLAASRVHVNQKDTPSGKYNKDEGGRPVNHASTYGLDKSSFGRDPIGGKEVKSKSKLDKSIRNVFQKGSPMALTEEMSFESNIAELTRKCNLYKEAQTINEISLLDESRLLNDLNIKDDIINS